MKRRININESDLNKIVSNVLKRVNESRFSLNESVNDELFQKMKNELYNMHKELNKMQRTLMMTGMSEDEYFAQVQQLDQAVQGLMNTGILAQYNTSF